MGGRLLEEQGHFAPDRFAEVTTGGCHTTGTPLCPAAMSNPEPKFALVPIARGSSRPHPRKGARKRWVPMLSTPASSPSASVPVPSLSFLLCFFSPGLFIFLRGRNVGNLPQGWPSFFFFFRLHSSLFYMKEAAERQMAEWRRQRVLADCGTVLSALYNHPEAQGRSHSACSPGQNLEVPGLP